MEPIPASKQRSFLSDLRNFPVFGRAGRWVWERLKEEFRLRGGAAGVYREYPSLLGQVIFFTLFMLVNQAFRSAGIDTAARAPGVLFFPFDLLNFNFLKEPYLLVFVLFAFMLGWIVNRIVLRSSPRLLDGSNAVLLATNLATGVISLLLFGVVFSLMVLFFS